MAEIDFWTSTIIAIDNLIDSVLSFIASYYKVALLILTVEAMLVLRHRVLTWRNQDSTNSVLILDIALVMYFASMMILFVPPLQTAGISDRVAKFDAENEARKTVLSVIAGLAVIGGLHLTWRRIVAIEKGVEVDRDGRVTDRYAKAVGMLDSKNQTMRLGGIYALERVAKDSDPDYWPVMEVLTTFVRIHFPYSKPFQAALTSKDVDRGNSDPTHADLQAIMDVIGRRKKEQIKKDIEQELPLNLKDVDFSRLNLKDADLRGINFFRSNFYKTDLREAKLSKSSLWKAEFPEAKLQGAKLQGCQLHGAILEGANIEGADLSTAENLDPDQIKLAKNWRKAILPAELRAELMDVVGEDLDKEPALD